MSLSWELQDNKRVCISGELTRSTVPQFWQERSQWLQEESLTIDLAGLEHVDTAGVALLIEIKRCLNGSQDALKLENANQQLRDIAAVSGVGSLLSLS